MKTKKELGQFMKELRVKHAISADFLACKLGYFSADAVHHYERGQSLPPVRHVPMLSKMLEIRAEVLLRHIFDARFNEALDQLRSEVERRKMKHVDKPEVQP